MTGNRDKYTGGVDPWSNTSTIKGDEKRVIRKARRRWAKAELAKEAKRRK